MSEDITLLKEKKLLTVDGLCKLYSFKVWGVRDLLRRGRIPHVRIGKRIFFDPVEIDVWIAKRRVKAVA